MKSSLAQRIEAYKEAIENLSGDRSIAMKIALEKELESLLNKQKEEEEKELVNH